MKNKEIRELLRISEIIDFKDKILDKNPPWRTGRIIGLYKHFVLIEDRHYKTAANYFDIKGSYRTLKKVLKVESMEEDDV